MRKNNIFLVEDEALIAMAKKKELEQLGYAVHHVFNGENALKAVLEPGASFDLILMDIDLGQGMDGTQAAEKILEKIDLPIVFLSSHTEPEFVEKTEKITSYGFVVKNSGIFVLDAAIKMALRLFKAKLEGKEARKKGQQSEENLRITLKSIGDAVIATDLHGLVTWMNPVAESLTGWTIAGAKNQPLERIFNIINTRTGKTAMNPVKQVLKTGNIAGLANHTKLISKNGDEYQIADSGAPIKDENGVISGVVMVFRDVSEEYRMREELKKSENQLKKAQNIGKNGSWVLNLDTGKVEASEETYRIYGIEPLLPLTVQDIQKIPLPEYRNMLDGALDKLIKGKEKYNVKFRIKRPCDNQIVDIHSIAEYNQQENSVTGILQDISEQKQTEETLREESGLLSMIMETSPAGIVTVDAEGSITYANNRAEQILGLKKEEITKRTYDEPLWKHTDLDGNPFPDEKQPFYIVKTTQRSVYGIQHGIVWPDGKTVILSINASPMKDSAGNFRGMIATVEDITSRKRAEETILHQLKEKEILLKEVHHRVKNNISSIEGMLYIQMDGASSREAKKILKTAIGRVQSMRVIYDKLLWSSDYKDDSAVNYFEELVTAIKKIFPEKNKISVETRIDDFRLDIEVLFSLGTIVNELITNSIKHAFRNSDSGRIEILLEKNKNEISLTVRDNGKGIPADFKIEKTGSFGLMLVRMLSDQLKGALTIDNSDGAKFMLKFKIENG